LSVQYPVQLYLRETYNDCHYSVSSNYRFIKRKIKNFLRHPRKDFRNSVFDKGGDIDMVEMIVLFHLGCVVELVEREKYLEFICSDTEKEIQFVKQLKEAYDYAKGGRQKILDDIDKYILTLEKDNFMAYIDMDKHLNECDTVLCDFVVKNREKFWT